jgi:Uma2 family endonuclease
VLLVVEIAVTSLDLDRAKAATYARMGIPEYWLVDVTGRTLECRRRPSPSGYGELRSASEDDSMTLPATNRVVTVASLLG